MADEEVKEGQAEEKKKGGGSPLMIILIVLIVILIAAVGVGGWFVYNKLNNPDDDGGNDKVAKEEAGDSKEFFKAEIKDLVLNITNAKGRAKLMKLSFSIKSTEPTIEAVVENNKAEIVDTVIAQISARSSEELLTIGGKELLKEELVEELNLIINEATATNEDIKRNNVRKIFFTAFVIK